MPQLHQSGWLLGRLIDALRLHAPFTAREEIKERTVRRYLQGEESAKPSTRLTSVAVFVEILFPEDLLRPEAATREQARESVDALLTAWDHAIGRVNAGGWEIERWDHAYLPWIRLLLLDLAVRVAAYLSLQQRRVPSESAWQAVATGRTFAEMAQWMRKAGTTPYPREQLAKDAGIAESTLDEWLSGARLPQSENIEQIAHALAPRMKVTPAVAALELRTAVAASVAVEALVSHLGQEGVNDVVRALASYVEFAHLFLSQSRLTGSQRTQKLWQLVLGGSLAPEAAFIYSAMSKVSIDQELLAELHALMRGAWIERVMSWYRDGDLLRSEHTKAELVQMFGCSREEAAALFDVTVRMELLPVPLHPRQPLASGDNQFIRISGDTAFKKANREQQWMHADAAGDYQVALEHARRLVELDATNAKYHLWLGATLSKLGHVDEAINECHHGAQLDTGWCLPAAEVGIILLDHGRTEEACEVLQAVARERQPRNEREAAHVAYTLGVAMMRSRRFGDGVIQFRKALEHMPEHALAMDLLAHCLLELGERTEGRSWAKKARHRGQGEALAALEAGRYDQRPKS